MRKHMRVFEKDGHQLKTASPARAVELLARGYEEILDDDEPMSFLSRGERVMPTETAQAVRDRARAETPRTRPPSDERNNAPD